jgi:hypothetical protein
VTARSSRVVILVVALASAAAAARLVLHRVAAEHGPTR